MIAIGGSIPLLCLEGVPDLPGAPQDEAGLTRKFETSHVGGATCRKTPIPWSTFDQNQTPGHLFEGKPVDEGTTRRGTDTPVHRPPNPQVPHSTRHVACHPMNFARVKQSSIPPHKTRPDSPVPTLQGLCDPSQIRHIRSQESNPEVPASTCHEALFHCTKPSGVPRGPSQLHSDPDFSEAR